MPLGTADRSTPEGNQSDCSAIRQHEATSELAIYIKTIYEWLYHVRGLIRTHKAIRSLVEGTYCNKLDPVVNFALSSLHMKKVCK